MVNILNSIYKYYNTLKNVGSIHNNSSYYILLSKYIYDIFSKYKELNLDKKDIIIANSILECLSKNCITNTIKQIQDLNNINTNTSDSEDIFVTYYIEEIHTNNDVIIASNNYNVINIYFRNLPSTLEEFLLGNHYNVIDSFIIDDRFLEYNPDTVIEVGAGSDVLVVKDSNDRIKYNILYNTKINNISDDDITLIVS